MMEEMPKVYHSLFVAYIDCDESDLIDTLNVETVQTVVILHPEGSMRKMEKIEGTIPQKLTEVVDRENTFYQ